jgi:D-serine deaminase-like pyridoxal phosphate-dependent protein
LSAPNEVRQNGTFVQQPSLTVNSVSEEHGVVYLPKGHRPPSLGSKLDIYPNYASNVVNLFDKLWIVQDDDVITTWNITARGKSV